MQSLWELQRWSQHSRKNIKKKKTLQSIVIYFRGVNSLVCNYIINLGKFNDYDDCSFTAVPACCRWAINQMRKEGWPLQQSRDWGGYLSGMGGPPPLTPKSVLTPRCTNTQETSSRGVLQRLWPDKWNFHRSAFDPQRDTCVRLNLFFNPFEFRCHLGVPLRKPGLPWKKAKHVNIRPANNSPYRSGLWRRIAVHP